MTKNVLIIFCCLSSSMHYAMEEPESKWFPISEKRESWHEKNYEPVYAIEKSLAQPKKEEPKLPNTFTFKIHFNNQGFPYRLSLLHNKIDEYPIAPYCECIVDETNIHKWSLDIFKGSEFLETKKLSDFCCREPQPYFVGIPFENLDDIKFHVPGITFSDTQYEAIWQRFILHQYQVEDRIDNRRKSLQEHKNIITIRAYIYEDFQNSNHLSYTLSLSYLNVYNESIPIDWRDKTFIEQHITKRPYARGHALGLGIQFPLVLGSYIPESFYRKIYAYVPQHAMKVFAWNQYFYDKTLRSIEGQYSSDVHHALRTGYAEGVALSSTATLISLYGLYTAYRRLLHR